RDGYFPSHGTSTSTDRFFRLSGRSDTTSGSAWKRRRENSRKRRHKPSRSCAARSSDSASTKRRSGSRSYISAGASSVESRSERNIMVAPMSPRRCLEVGLKTLPPIFLVLAALTLGWAADARAKSIDLDAATIADINAAFDAGTLTAEKLVQL